MRRLPTKSHLKFQRYLITQPALPQLYKNELYYNIYVGVLALILLVSQNPHLTGFVHAPSGPLILAPEYDVVIESKPLIFLYSLVAVHGSKGYDEEAWVETGASWLRDLLPLDIPNARVLSWTYDANEDQKRVLTDVLEWSVK